MRKYLHLFNNFFATALEYRANLVGILLLEYITVLGIVILRIAIYRTNDIVGGLFISRDFALLLAV